MEDLRIRLQEGNKKRRMSGAPTQEELKKVTDELNELRREMAKIREEAKEKGLADIGFALGFKMEEFMAMSQTKSLQWVTNVLAPKLKERVNKYRSYFAPIILMGGKCEMEAWTCAGFNRGGTCHSKWHVYERYGHRSNKEVRLHCCTLCKDALGVFSEHKLIDCPWLKRSTWYEVTGVAYDDLEEEKNNASRMRTDGASAL